MTLILTALLSFAPAAHAQSWPTELTFCDLYPEQCDWQLYPDLSVRDMVIGCEASTPTLVITVDNLGLISATTWVDAWFGQATAPSMGDYGDHYGRLTVPAGSYRTITFALDEAYNTSNWVDVILDTDQIVAESNESNNTDYEWLTVPDCSLH